MVLFSCKMLILYKRFRESCTTVNWRGPGSLSQQLRWPPTARLCPPVCVVAGCYNRRLMKARGFTKMVHEAAVQLMLQLCSKDSSAVLWISLCAYVIRIHGTAARPGASDPENVKWDEMGGKRTKHTPWTPNIRHGHVKSLRHKISLLFTVGIKHCRIFWDTGDM